MDQFFKDQFKASLSGVPTFEVLYQIIYSHIFDPDQQWFLDNYVYCLLMGFKSNEIESMVNLVNDLFLVPIKQKKINEIDESLQTFLVSMATLPTSPECVSFIESHSFLFHLFKRNAPIIKFLYRNCLEFILTFPPERHADLLSTYNDIFMYCHKNGLKKVTDIKDIKSY